MWLLRDCSESLWPLSMESEGASVSCCVAQVGFELVILLAPECRGYRHAHCTCQETCISKNHKML
jgi:hypothetical protein